MGSVDHFLEISNCNRLVFAKLPTSIPRTESDFVFANALDETFLAMEGLDVKCEIWSDSAKIKRN